MTVKISLLNCLFALLMTVTFRLFTCGLTLLCDYDSFFSASFPYTLLSDGNNFLPSLTLRLR